LLGPFEEEEEGIGIASDVVKVQGKDPATPGCLREVRVKWCINDFSKGERSPFARSFSLYDFVPLLSPFARS